AIAPGTRSRSPLTATQAKRRRPQAQRDALGEGARHPRRARRGGQAPPQAGDDGAGPERPRVRQGPPRRPHDRGPRRQREGPAAAPGRGDRVPAAGSEDVIWRKRVLIWAEANGATGGTHSFTRSERLR